ncbi:hypothetical protein AOC36_02765 [Erysipelothrix larvae]|uniref:Uncharacterized protein n=1 Tax=Erysipelothrix larvae TaxID=1514105 RepID=A0A0X8GYX9_9FIRM|nr:DUF6709 family protein [Erysipelothrix larvae]AMC92944.1 hypothetical protein AOC36_02765 [Erysipelothrix larvae]
MEKLLKLRNRKFTTVIVVGLTLLGMEMIFLSRPVMNSMRMIMNQSHQPISTSEKLNDVSVNDIVVLDSEFIDASGFGYYSNDKLVIDYTLGAFEDEYILVVQPLGKGITKTVLVDRQVQFVGKRVNDHDSVKARASIVSDFADYYEITEEEAETYFAPEIIEFVGVVGDVPLWPIVVIAGTALIVIGLAAYVKKSHQKKIKEVLEYDEALHIASQLELPEFQTKHAILVDKYLINKNAWNAKQQFIMKDTIAWAYMHTMRNSFYGIPIHKSYSVMIYVNGTKKPIQISMTEHQVQTLLSMLHEMNQGVVVGYTQSWIKLWKKTLNKADFRQLILETQESN